MRTLAIVTVIALGTFVAPSFALDNRPASSSERQWLSIPQIHAKLEAAGYRNVEKIEREHGNYKVKATAPNGARTKLYLNPQTGEVIDQRRRETRHDQYDRGDSPNADCNQRRCRDDLPQPATPPTGK